MSLSGAYVARRDPSEIRAAVAGARGPLAGWALAVKDVISVAGQPRLAGSRVFAAVPEVRSAAVVVALEAAGTVVVGRTATHELAFGVTGVNLQDRVPRNPRAPGCVPGGSSSGSAVAVAEGSARVALGTDTGGSTRIPAALCGVAGFKPSVGRYPAEGVLPLAPTLDCVGLLARRVEDLDAVDRVLVPGPRSDGASGRLGVDAAAFAAADPGLRDRFAGALAAVAAAGWELHGSSCPTSRR